MTILSLLSDAHLQSFESDVQGKKSANEKIADSRLLRNSKWDQSEKILDK